jgi:cytochrome P450
VTRGPSSSLGASVTVAQLERDPHPLLARLREREPVSWIPALGGWLVTRADLVLQAMRDPATFTVDDPRFSTAQVIGPSMLSLDGTEHERHRAPFVEPFRAGAVEDRFEATTKLEAGRLLHELEPHGAGELRRSFAGPLAAAVIARALGLGSDEAPSMLAWYDAIVAAVTEITAGDGSGEPGRQAFAALRERLRAVMQAGEQGSLLAAAGRGSELTADQVISNAAVLLFGGIETTEGMIANAVLKLLEHPDSLEQVRREPALLNAAIEESLRLEPAAAVLDRYATANAALGDVEVARGDLVRLSISAANRDPQTFEDPDRFDLSRKHTRRHLAFAQGPHVCVGVHLARLETRVAVGELLARLPDLRLDPLHPARVRGLVFRKPQLLQVLWGCGARPLRH